MIFYKNERLFPHNYDGIYDSDDSFDSKERDEPNIDLTEITDIDSVKKIKENFNINFNELEEV